jgi:GNAT superfamily N-acetyltransferase
MTQRPLTIVEIDASHPNATLLRAAFDDVLRPSFRPPELSSFDALAAAVTVGGYGAVLIALDEDGVVGAAVDQRFPDQRIALLAYLAARPDHRGVGIGTQLLMALERRWATQPIDVVLGEVEDPRVYPETAENRTEARLRFYERQGAQLLGVPWIQPGLEGGERVAGLLLLAFWTRPSLDVTITGQELADWADEYYRSEEGSVPVDEQYRALSARLTTYREVPVFPVAELPRAVPLGPWHPV